MSFIDAITQRIIATITTTNPEFAPNISFTTAITSPRLIRSATPATKIKSVPSPQLSIYVGLAVNLASSFENIAPPTLLSFAFCALYTAFFVALVVVTIFTKLRERSTHVSAKSKRVTARHTRRETKSPSPIFPMK